MPYVPLDPADIVAGKPTKEEIFQQIHDNLESLNTSVENLSQTSKFDLFNIKYSGLMSRYSLSELNDLSPVYRASINGEIVEFKATLLEASTSGTLELDIQKSIDNGVNWISMLNNPVQLTGTSVGSISGSVDWLDQTFLQGDLMRVRFVNIQIDQGAFHLDIFGETV